MAQKGQNIEHWAGNDLLMRFTVKDSSGAPVNLTGAYARWRLSKTSTPRTGPNILLDKTSDDDQQVFFDHPNSFWRVLVRLVPNDTENIPANPNYYHECEVVIAGVVTTVAIGKFKLNNTVIPIP